MPKDINDLRRDRKQAADDMKAKAEAIAELEGAEETTEAQLTEAQEAFETAQAAFEGADKAVKRAEQVEAAQASAAVSESPAEGTRGGNGGEGQRAHAPAPAQPRNPDDQAVDVGLMVAALAATRGDQEKAAARLEVDGHSGVSAALSGASEAAGGVTVPRPLASGIIEMLAPRVTVRASGAMVHDMPAGELRNARVASGPSASYGTENAAAVESEPTFDKVDESFKKLTSLVPVGNSLLRHSSASLGRVVRDLMIQAMALKEDIAFLRYDGSSNDPVGLREWALAAHWQDTVANGVAAVETALRKAVSDVEDANVMMVSPGWIMRASAKNFLASLRDPNSGAYVFPSIVASGTLLGYPIRTTSQIPNNLGAGSNETEIYFAAFGEIMIGDSQTIVVGTSTEAAYVNQSGDTVSAFQNDLTLMRAIAEHDLAPAHDEAIAGISGVDWSL